MMKRSHAIAVVLLGVFAIAVAKDWFLWAPNMTHAQDSASEYSATQNFVGMVSPTMNANGSWRAGDTFTVQYSDGVVMRFTLSNRGMRCTPSLTGTKCFWDTVVPLDTPGEVIQTGKPPGASLPSPIVVQAASDSGIDISYARQNAYTGYYRTDGIYRWIVTAPPVIMNTGGGGKCMPYCVISQ